MVLNCFTRQGKTYYMEDKKVKLYQNVYRSNINQLVYYQQYHESLEDALKTFRRQGNGDEPAFVIEVVAYVVHEPRLLSE
jgi:hypothetical protein